MDRPIDIAARLLKKFPKLDELDLEHINTEIERLRALPDDEAEAELEGMRLDAIHLGHGNTIGLVWDRLLREIRLDRAPGR